MFTSSEVKVHYRAKLSGLFIALLPCVV